MRWLVLILPSLAWAYTPVVPAVPGAIAPQAVVAQAVAAQVAGPQAALPQAIVAQAVATQVAAPQAALSQAAVPEVAGPHCKPLVQCSVWYVELLGRPQRTCVSEVRGAVGLHCPNIVHVTG